MHLTRTRLAAYIAAEAAILKGQEVRGGDRSHRMAELAEVRRAITELQRQIAREEAAAGGRGLNYSLANLSRE